MSQSVGDRKSVHPLYSAMLETWEEAAHCYAGEKVVKSKRDTYLPPTAGMVSDGFGAVSGESIGDKAYNAYITRAVFPELLEEAVQTAVGVMHRKEATFELTPKLETLLERATDKGEGLDILLRLINTRQLSSGRVGLFGDIRVLPDGTEEPVLMLYNEREVYNWNDMSRNDDVNALRMVMVDESAYEMCSNTFTWKWKERSRILALVDPTDMTIAKFDEDGKLPSNVIYGYAEVDGGSSLEGLQFTPVSVKGTDAAKIPFVFINAQDLSPSPSTPPLKSIISLSFAIYRGEADYRQNLFMQGQDTFVTIGAGNDDENKPLRVGAGAAVNLPSKGDAKYVGVNSQGLPEQRQALAADYERANKKMSKLMSSDEGGAESGAALKTRVAAQTASLPQIAVAGAAGLQDVLRTLAEMLGENPEDVVVTPNLEFADTGGDALTLKGIVESKVVGAPISDRSIHAWMVENGFTRLTYEEEVSLMSQEQPKL